MVLAEALVEATASVAAVVSAAAVDSVVAVAAGSLLLSQLLQLLLLLQHPASARRKYWRKPMLPRIPERIKKLCVVVKILKHGDLFLPGSDYLFLHFLAETKGGQYSTGCCNNNCYRACVTGVR